MERRKFFQAIVGLFACLLVKPRPAQVDVPLKVLRLGRPELFELGKRGPYYRYLNFPVSVFVKVEG